MATLVINVVVFQIVWFASVLGAAHSLPWLGMLSAFLALGLHFKQAKDKIKAMQLVLLSTVIGSLLDQTLFSLGYSHFPQHDLHPAMLPSWMYALWIGFASTLNISLRWMQGRYGIALLFGLIGGPLAYFSASRLGAISFTSPHISYIALGLGWGVLTPLLLKLATHLDGFTPLTKTARENTHV